MLVLGFVFTNHQATASSFTDGIHNIVDSNMLANGVEYQNIKRLTTAGWWNINVVRVDISNEDNEIKNLISDKGVSNRETVTDLTNQNDALAGINGNFFEYSPIPAPIGGIIQDGEIISSTVEKAYTWPSFMIDNENNAKTVLMDRTMMAKSTRSKKSSRIIMINKAKKTSEVANGLVLYNHHWGDYSPGNRLNKNVTEIVVDKDKVTHIRPNQAPVKLNKDRYVLHFIGNARDNVKNFKMGDTVELNVDSTPDLENIKFLVGGGSQILKNGVPTATHLNLKGNHPRTGIGVSKDGKEIILATIDGRDTKYKGVSQENFGAILKSLGMYDAVNLDGGGSTTMAVKKPKDDKAKLVNKPSDGGQRKVTDGVGVVSNAKKGKLTHIELETTDKNIFKDTSREFRVKGKDGLLNDVKIDNSKIELSVEGVEGDFKGLSFYPKSKGIATIRANYEGMTASMRVRILDNPQSIEIPYKEFSIKPGEKKYINPIYVNDGNGFKALVYPRDMDLTVSNDLGEFKNGWFYPNDNGGSGIISLKLGNAVNSMLVSTGEKTVDIDDFNDIDNLSFSSHPSYVKGDVEINDLSKMSNKSIKLSYDFTKGNEVRAAYINFKKPISLEGQPKTIGLWLKGDGMYSTLKGTLVDDKNKSHSITFTELIDSEDWKYVETSIPENIKAKELTQIYVLESAKVANHKGAILIDGLSIGYSPSYNHIKLPPASKTKDEKNYKAEVEDGGFSFMITKAQDSLDKITGAKSLDRIKKIANGHDVSIFMDGISSSFSKGLESDLVINSGSPFYLGKNYKNTLFMNINSRAGGIRAQNADQWYYIKNNLRESKADHIVAVLPTKVFGSGGFKDAMEARVLHEILLEEYNKGKTVWVVQGSNQSKVDIREGIRYMEFDTRNVNNNTIKNLKAIEFVVNGEDISYQIKSIF